ARISLQISINVKEPRQKIQPHRHTSAIQPKSPPNQATSQPPNQPATSLRLVGEGLFRPCDQITQETFRKNVTFFRHTMKFSGKLVR
ncbi:MAG TPA: hypothetical protein VGC40_06150, partial [Paenirhodobacter sp.]